MMDFWKRKVSLLSVAGALFAASGQIATSADVLPTEPERFLGISVLPLDDHPVPDVLKNQARVEIDQMKNRGFVEATESEVAMLETAKADKARLRPMSEVVPKLRMVPANLGDSVLGRSTVLGAAPNGGYVDDGWTGLMRVMVVPKLGLVGLEEVDFIASGGGLALIKEAVNQDVNGSPAILRVKQSHSRKEMSQITWATSQKIYTLSVNRGLKSERAIEEFVSLARTITD